MTLLPARQTFFRFLPSGLSPCPRRRYLCRLCLCVCILQAATRASHFVSVSLSGVAASTSASCRRELSVPRKRKRRRNGCVVCPKPAGVPACVCVCAALLPRSPRVGISGFARRTLLAMLHNCICLHLADASRRVQTREKRRHVVCAPG